METEIKVSSSASQNFDTKTDSSCMNGDYNKLCENIDMKTTENFVAENHISGNTILQNYSNLKNGITAQNVDNGTHQIKKNSAEGAANPVVVADQKDVCVKQENNNQPLEYINNQPNTDVADYLVVEEKVTDDCWSWVVLSTCTFSTLIMGSSYVFFSLIYRDIVEEFESTTANAGWIGSMHVACVNVFGIPIGIAIDILGPRKVASFGVVLCSFGFFLSSFAYNIATMVFSYGFLAEARISITKAIKKTAGIGLGIMNLCSLIQTLSYFDKKRPIGAAIYSCGYSIGAIFIGPILNIVFKYYSWRGAFVLFAAFILQILVLIVGTFKPQKIANVRIERNTTKKCEDTEKKEPLLSLSPRKTETVKKDRNVYVCSRIVSDCSRKYRLAKILLTDPAFAAYILSCFFLYIGTQCYVQHLPKRALELEIERKKVSYVPISCSAVSCVMKIASGIIGNLPGVNRLLMFACAILGAGVSQCIVPLCTTFESLLLHGVLEGIFIGMIFSLFSVNLVDLKGISNITFTQPILILAFGTAAFISTPFGGLLYDKFNYDVTFITTGCLIILGALFSFNALRLVKKHKSKTIEV